MFYAIEPSIISLQYCVPRNYKRTVAYLFEVTDNGDTEYKRYRSRIKITPSTHTNGLGIELNVTNLTHAIWIPHICVVHKRFAKEVIEDADLEVDSTE